MTIPIRILLSACMVVVCIVTDIGAETQSMPYKYAIDILAADEYHVIPVRPFLRLDDTGRLLAPFEACWGYMTDAYHPRASIHILVSGDNGLTWKLSDMDWPESWPGPTVPRNDSENKVIYPDGTIVKTGMTGWVRYPRSQIPRLQKEGYYVWDLGEEEGYCAVANSMWMKRSTDGGKTWAEKSVTKQFPFFAHFVVRNLILLKNDTLINFCYGYHKPGDPSTAYVLRSRDKGDTWELIRIAGGPGSGDSFNETFPVVFPNGQIMAMLRVGLGQPGFVVRSLDEGKTWSQPEKTPITSKHLNLTLLRDGDVVCTYPQRCAPPYGIRARFTRNMGKTWSREVILRDDITLNDGLYEPYTIELGDKTLFTLFGAKKMTDEGKQVSFLGGVRWTRDYQHPLNPEIPLPPVTPKFNTTATEKRENK